MELGNLLNELESFYEHKTIKMKSDYVLLPKYHSYRGYYHQLAIDYASVPGFEEITVKQLKDTLYEALEVGVMEGYKGGEYAIDTDTKVVIAGYGDSGGLYIAEFIEYEDYIYLATADMDW